MKTPAAPATNETAPQPNSSLGQEFHTFAATEHGISEVEIFSFLRGKNIEEDVLPELAVLLLSGGQQTIGEIALNLNSQFANRAAMKICLASSPAWASLREKLTPIFSAWCDHRAAEAVRKQAEANELAEAQRAVVAAEEAAKKALDNDSAVIKAKAKVEAIAASRADLGAA